MLRIHAPDYILDGSGKRIFTNGGPGVEATIADDKWLNGVQEALCRPIEAAGMNVDGTGADDLDNFLKALQHPSLLHPIWPTGGTATAMTITPTGGTAISAYADHQFFRARITAPNNTGVTTLNVNGVGAVPIKRMDGKDLVPYDLVQGQIAEFYYYGGVFKLLNPLGIQHKGNPSIVKCWAYFEWNGSTHDIDAYNSYRCSVSLHDWDAQRAEITFDTQMDNAYPAVSVTPEFQNGVKGYIGNLYEIVSSGGKATSVVIKVTDYDNTPDPPNNGQALGCSVMVIGNEA